MQNEESLSQLSKVGDTPRRSYFRGARIFKKRKESEMSRTRTTGLTLIELLIVIAIISLLAAVLLPAVGTYESSTWR